MPSAILCPRGSATTTFSHGLYKPAVTREDHNIPPPKDSIMTQVVLCPLFFNSDLTSSHAPRVFQSLDEATQYFKTLDTAHKADRGGSQLSETLKLDIDDFRYAGSLLLTAIIRAFGEDCATDLFLAEQCILLIMKA